MTHPKVALLLPYELGITPSQRYRWEQWLPRLEAAGLSVRTVCSASPAIGAARRGGRGWLAALLMTVRYPVWLVQAIRAGRAADVVVIHRNAALAGPPLAEAVLALMGKSLVYDLDDAVYLPPDHGDNFLRRLLRCDWRAAFIGRRAAMVGAGNPTLAAHMRQFCDRVVEWPSTVDTIEYHPIPPKRANALPVVGWTGSPSTLPYLEAILPQIAALQADVAFEMRVIGGTTDLAAFGLRGCCIPWTAETEVAETGSFDIGLMPQEDTPWARGKCALKAIQYQALARPAVVSDVGVNRVVVQDGETGFLVPPGGDWAPPLRRLLADPALRRAMGEKARARVEAHYSAQVVATRVAADLESLIRD